MSVDVELKSIVADLIKQLSEMMNITIPVSLLNSEILKFYDKGLEDMGLKFQMNFTRNEARVDLLRDYVVNNIKDLNDEITSKIRKEITQGVVNLDNINTLTKKIDEIAEVGINRARMIARTELNRATNMAHKDAAIQSGLPLKKVWVSHIDSRTSPICRHLNGTKIDVNKKFVYEDKEWDIPPAHVNCRSRIIYEYDD